MLVLAKTTRTFGFYAKSSSLCLIGFVVFLGAVFDRFRIVYADCWYNNQRHTENSEVATGEPCLNCTCSRSVLLCYLRVCPKLPNPPPPGCILLHRYKTCCPELICSDFHDGGNSLEARSDPEGDLDIPSDDQSAYDHACISNGSIYGPGSAMHSSSFCEYCYCLGGKQICVKPKCLLPIEGCTPVFEDTNCCPVRYNCTAISQGEIRNEVITTTTQTTSTMAQRKDGCLVDGNHYSEGSKVIGVGHSVCDNCYCLRGLLRCEPFSCAPPLLGCTPVVRSGECCAASYNCNGTLEIEAEPNYGLFPTISKEYSKLRKEVHRKTSTKLNKDGVVTVAPFYVLAETLQDPTTKFVYQRSPDTYGTTRHFSGVVFNPSSTQKPFKEASSTSREIPEDNFYLISSSKHRSTTGKPVVKHRTVPGVYHATTNYEFQNQNYKRVYSTTLRSSERSLPTRVRTRSTVPPAEKKEDSSDYLGFENLNIFSIVDSLLNNKVHRKIDNSSEIDGTVNENVTESDNESKYIQTNAVNISSTDSSIDKINNEEATVGTEDTTDESTIAMETTTFSTESDGDSTSVTEEYNMTTTMEYESAPITVTSVVKSTDCINNIEQILEKDSNSYEVTTIIPIDPGEVNKLAETKTEFLTTTDFDVEVSSSENSSTEEAAFVDVKLRNKDPIGLSKLSPDIEAILNVTQHKNRDDFDYDYNEPTLPPSLPNLKIIPFVAADALDTKKEAPKDPSPILIDKKIDEGPFEYSTNLFSPPVKTEGGFVPKEPPILDTFYDTAVPVPSLTNEPSENINVNCLSDGHEVEHGMSVPSDSPCMTCTCFYGNIVCQKPNCPPPRPGCKKAVEQGVTLCCPNYICGEPSLPSLDALEIPQEIVTVAEGIIPLDPFKDVIRTEPAPNLQSLIGDMISLQRTTTTSTSLPPPVQESSENPQEVTSGSKDAFNLDDIFKYIFSGQNSEITENSETDQQMIQKESSEDSLKSKESNFNNTASVETREDSIISKNITSSESLETATTTKVPDIHNDFYIKPYRQTINTEKHTNNQTNKISTNSSNNKIHNSKLANSKEPSSKNSNSVGVGLLKLAGCNIYGRMYRVGRIISELSGPCLECKCTEVGVQCRPLEC